MADPSFNIETPNLYICHFLPDSQEHINFLIDLVNTELVAEGKPATMTPEKAIGSINFFNSCIERMGHGIYLVLLKSTPAAQFPAGTPIGEMSLMQGNPEKDEHWHTAPDLGWQIHPSFTGRGYATEAAKALIKYADEVLGKKEMFVFTAASNKPSRRVAEKAGFEFKGEQALAVFGNKVECVYALPGMSELESYTMHKEKA
jgi:RimJ/RimL family protein N-acetyltransferase